MASHEKSFGALLAGGVASDNPLFRLGLGVCPALAVTTTALNGLGMGVATGCVLILTSLVMGLLGGMLSEKGRVPVALTLSAGFASVACMIVKGWFPALFDALGIFLPLMAVSSLILARAGGFAAERGAVAGLADAIGMGVGYTVALTLIGALRELIGKGTIFGAALLPAGYEPMLLAILPAGGLMIAGIAMGIVNALTGGRGDKKGGA